ncbi:MAG: ABC transporter permease [Lachnospiraceae bacterium]|nr:ABC transporter permease [Lachnospiraceae bacterium]
MLNLASRNFKMYFRDRAGVFFSFLAVIIIVGLYVLILGDQIKSGVADIEGASLMMDIWVMAGIIGVASFTTALGACGIIVEDRVKKNFKDFMSAPLYRWQIVGGYVISACLVALMMCAFIFVIVTVVLSLNGMPMLSFLSILKISGVIILAALSSGAVTLFITSFLRTNGAYGAVSTVLGTLIGFFTGMYFPIGMLSDNIQVLVKLFPTTHACVLLRKIMMEDQMAATFLNAPAEIVSDFEKQMGVVIMFGDYAGTAWLHVGVLVATVFVFSALAILNLSRKAKVC